MEPFSLKNEVWLDIIGYENLYKVSNLGRIISFKTNKILKNSVSSTSGYGRVNLYKEGFSKTVEVHRIVAKHFISNFTDDCIVDHIDCNKLNCSVSNLRITDYFGNARNVTKSKKTMSSKYKGVYWNKSRKKWQVNITFNYKVINLGRFDSEEEAALVYNKKALELFGEFARLNNV